MKEKRIENHSQKSSQTEPSTSGGNFNVGNLARFSGIPKTLLCPLWAKGNPLLSVADFVILNSMAMAKAKTNGRPPKGADEKLGKAVTVKFTIATFEKVEQQAKQAGITVAEYLRKSALSAKIVPRHSTEDNTVARSLMGIANNLNQLTKLSHQQGLWAVVSELSALITRIKTIINSYRQ